MENGQHDFRRRLAAGVQVDRNAAAVVDDGDRVVDVDGDVDLIAESGQRLVDRVVDDLVDEVVQPGRAGGPDVHRRALPHRLEAFEDLDLVGAVVVGRAIAAHGRLCLVGESGVWLIGVLLFRMFHAFPWIRFRSASA